MAQTYINGEAYAWVKTTFGLLNNPIVIGVAAIKYDRKKTIVNHYLTGEEPQSYGEGKAEYECSIKLDEVEVRRILSSIPSGLPRKLSAIPPFTVTVSYRNGNKVTTDKIYNWRFLADGVDAKEGDTNIMREIPSMCAGIDYGLPV